MVLGFMRNENSMPIGQLSVESLYEREEESTSLLRNLQASVLHASQYNQKEIWNNEGNESTSYSMNTRF